VPANAQDYYAMLGVEPMADAAAIDAAYQGRSLRFRVGQLRHRTQDLAGPTQEEIEHAYAILGNPESRALYDAVYYPEKVRAAPKRRGLPPWVWAIAVAWVVAIVVVACIGVRSKVRSDDGAIERIVKLTATALAAGGGGAGTATTAPTLAAAVVTPTVSPTVVAAVSATPIAASATSVAVASPTVTRPAPTATATVAPTATIAPTATATTLPTPAPTATVVPTATPVPPPPTPEPPPTATPEPPPPSFQPTDRIGVPVNVNLRNGPGTGFASLGPLVPGTLLQATGETATTGGQLWRRFVLEDGRVGWVRDVDVLPVR
jgi:hypothetical protein